MTDDESLTPVIRVLTQTGIGVSPAGIAANVDHLTEDTTTESEVRALLDDLADDNIVETIGDTEYYRLTDYGRDYASTRFSANAFGYVD